jgi:hypothetical protein
MFEITPTFIVVMVVLIAVVVCYLFFRRMRNQQQLIQDMQNKYAALLQDIRRGNQQQVMNTAESLSDTRHRALASLFENVDMQLSNLMNSIMRRIMNESAHSVAIFANSIDAGGGNSGGGGGSSGGSTRSPQPLPPSPPPSTPPRTASAQSTRPSAAVQDLFKSVSSNTTYPSAGEDPEVYIKAIEAISQLYHKRTQQGSDEKRPMTS